MYCIEQRGCLWHSPLTVHPSPLQGRIAELCSAAVATEDLEELEWIVPQLKAALQKQIAYLRQMVEEAKEVIAQRRACAAENPAAAATLSAVTRSDSSNGDRNPPHAW